MFGFDSIILTANIKQFFQKLVFIMKMEARLLILTMNLIQNIFITPLAELNGLKQKIVLVTIDGLAIQTDFVYGQIIIFQKILVVGLLFILMKLNL
jgi:hypothetical protein